MEGDKGGGRESSSYNPRLNLSGAIPYGCPIETFGHDRLKKYVWATGRFLLTAGWHGTLSISLMIEMTYLQNPSLPPFSKGRNNPPLW